MKVEKKQEKEDFFLFFRFHSSPVTHLIIKQTDTFIVLDFCTPLKLHKCTNQHLHRSGNNKTLTNQPQQQQNSTIIK